MNVREDHDGGRTYSLAASPTAARRGGLESPPRRSLPTADEALIVDARCQVRPAQQVEDKLLSLLKCMFVPVSQVRLSSLCNERGRNGYSRG